VSETLRPLDACGTRLTVEEPPVRYDKQGEHSDAERVAAAMRAFARDFGRTAALYLESCIRCGNCAQACHFYLTTRDPKYTGPFAWLHRTFDLEPAVTVERLQQWQELLYDACTMCGRCTMACPMGIDIASLVGLARHAMFDAGLVPHELWAVADRAAREGSPLGATPKVLKDRIEWLADDYDVEIHLDEPKADVLVTFSSIEIMKYPESIVATARVLDHAGYAWTISSAGYEATNFGMMSGNVEWQRQATMKLIDAAIACGAKIVVLPECGHSYMALRWQGANLLGRPLPFRVVHISEFLAENIANGRIRVKKLAKSVAFHDPCQVSRRGGATSAPREVLEALGVELRETRDAGALNFCCGGGGGVIANRRADALRYGAFAIKMRQLDATGAELMLTSCANCRQTFDHGSAHFQWRGRMDSLLELVGDRLDDREPTSSPSG
jgi:Fe-S oxidoreductase